MAHTYNNGVGKSTDRDSINSIKERGYKNTFSIEEEKFFLLMEAAIRV